MAAFIPIIMLVINYRGTNLVHETLTNISQGAYYLFLYFSVFMLSFTSITINSSENFKGAWIYKALPIEFPGVILMGALKGFMLKYLIPVYLFVSILFAIPYGVRLIPHLILIFSNMLLLIILLFKLSPKELPFGKEFHVGQDNRLWLVFGSIAFCGMSAALHYALKDFDVGLYLYIIAVLLVSAVLWKTSAKITWEKV